MMREDILTGLKNAIERGYSIKQAKQSFINAGYNVKEVEEAADSISRGTISASLEAEKKDKKTEKIKPKTGAPPKPGQAAPPPKKSKKGIIILILILLILIIGGIAVYLFREEIVSFIEELFNI